MIYDCFIFNTEFDLLKLRLEFLFNVVDKFVLVEAPRTLSGNPKPLHFKENCHLFKDYLSKIIYCECPNMPELKDWEYEYFQRNYIKEGLKDCSDDDTILISDVDEIVNIKAVLPYYHNKPALIELPVYYYFFNLKSKVTFKVNLITPYGFIRGKNIGERNATYPKWTSEYILMDIIKTGWHFSYLFGLDIYKYQEKIKAFSHQEYNTPFFINKERIFNCIVNGLDLFERNYIKYYFVQSSDYKELSELIKKTGLQKYIYKPSINVLIKQKISLARDNFYLFRKKIFK